MGNMKNVIYRPTISFVFTNAELKLYQIALIFFSSLFIFSWYIIGCAVAWKYPAGLACQLYSGRFPLLSHHLHYIVVSFYYNLHYKTAFDIAVDFKHRHTSPYGTPNRSFFLDG